MRDHILTRRAMVSGATACALVPVVPNASQAGMPPLLVGLNALVVLWNAIEIAGKIYDHLFPKKKESVAIEVQRIYGQQQVIINNYYQLGNPYKVPRLDNHQPGCRAQHSAHPNSTALCCGADGRAVFLPSGCIVALNFAVEELRLRYREDNIFAYTRPYRLIRPAQAWRQLDRDGFEWVSEMQYYSVSGSVSLQWYVSDRSQRICRGQYLVRDDHSKRVVAEGATQPFWF